MAEPTGAMQLATHVHTMTQLVDFPMFEKMLSTLKWVIGLCGAAIFGLGVAAWNDLKKRIGLQRKEDGERCTQCRQNHDVIKSQFHGGMIREMDALWDKLNQVCAKTGVDVVEPLEHRTTNGVIHE